MTRESTPREHLLAVCTLAFCGLLWSTAGLATRLLDSTTGLGITFWRSAFCALAMVGWLIWTRRSRWLASVREAGGAGLFSGVMWSIMFSCYTIALSLTSVARTLTMLAVAPLVAALLSRVVLRESVALRTWLAIGLAGVGILWMVSDGLSDPAGSTALLGMAVAAGVPLASGANIVSMKLHQRRLLSRTLPVGSGPADPLRDRPVDLVPAVLVGALLSALAMLPWSDPLASSQHDLLILAMLGFFQLALPCILMVRAARHLKPQETALLVLLEVVFGPLWAWLGVGERPADATLLGGSLILVALIGNELLGIPQRNRNLPPPLA